MSKVQFDYQENVVQVFCPTGVVASMTWPPTSGDEGERELRDLIQAVIEQARAYALKDRRR